MSKHYSVKEIYTQLQSLWLLSEPSREAAVHEFLEKHQVILSKLINKDRAGVCVHVLVKLYTYLGDRAQAKRRQREAVYWFERVLAIIVNLEQLKNTFADAFLNLACYHLISTNTKLAMFYVKKYKRYSGKSSYSFCHDIIASVENAQLVLKRAQASRQKLLKQYYKEDIYQIKVVIGLARHHAPPKLHVSLASYYAACSYPRKAVAQLQIALEKGYLDWDWVFADRDLIQIMRSRAFESFFLKYYHYM